MSSPDAWPSTDLERKLLRILDDAARWSAHGIGVNGGRVLPDESGLSIGIDPGDLYEAQLLFEDAYGPVVHVERLGQAFPA